MTKCEKFFYGMDRRLGKLFYDDEISLETKRNVMASLRYYVVPRKPKQLDR